MAAALRLIESFSASLRSPRSWSKLGWRLVFVTVHVKTSVSSTSVPSRTVSETGYSPAALKAIVPLIRPLEALIVSPGGRPLAA